MSTADQEPLPADIADAISRLRETSVGRLLLRASRQYSEAAMQRVRELGHPELTIAHAAILPHIDVEGTCVRDVATRAGMTKQSASELLSGLRRLGYLAQEPDPSDRRSQRVVFTPRGRQFLLAAYQAKTELERDLYERMGQHDGEQLVELLNRYIGTEQPQASPGASAEQ